MRQSNFGRETLLSFQCAVMAVAHFEVCDGRCGVAVQNVEG